MWRFGERCESLMALRGAEFTEGADSRSQADLQRFRASLLDVAFRGEL